MLNDAFFSIVQKDCPPGSLLVRARREGDIEKVFGRRTKVTRATDADYLFRAVIRREDVDKVMVDELHRIDYGNFKDSVADAELHSAYARVWTAMAATQDPRPYSEPYKPPYKPGKLLPVWTPMPQGKQQKSKPKKGKKP